VFVACYSSRREGDAVTEALRAQSHLWRDVADQNDDTLAETIRADGMDILVDLDGHTGGNRLGVFARKPAPVQVSWLGYPFTTGLEAMDYALSDRATVPVEAEAWFSETVHCLPVSRLCYQGPEAPLPTPPPVMTRGFVTFGSFNNIAKLGPEVMAAWAAILRAVPNSRLVLKWPHLAQAETAARIRSGFQAHGIETARIELRGDSPPAQVLAEYGDVDVALDPFPYCGAFTSCEALWMGVPVVTLPGPRPFSRQTLALVTALGLEQHLAAGDLAEYHALALALAHDPDRLAQLRSELRPAMRRTLGDSSRLVPALESFYREAWEKWCDARLSPGI
jgi:predicted O-linked N-acetylglucosamine transferase (SPINDLY family)